MVVAFLGLNKIEEFDGLVEIELEEFFNKHLKRKKVEFLLGGWEKFEKSALKAIFNSKDIFCRYKISFVFCNLTCTYLEKFEVDTDFDDILILENKDCSLQQAFTNNFKYMIQKADMVIAYDTINTFVESELYKYAKKLGKEIINIKEIIYS